MMPKQIKFIIILIIMGTVLLLLSFAENFQYYLSKYGMTSAEESINLYWPEDVDESICQVRYFVDSYEINVYITEKGQHYFFLPADASLEKLPIFFVVPDGYKLMVDGVELNTGYSYCNISNDMELEVSFISDSGISETTKYLFMQSSTHSMYLTIDEGLGSIEAMQKDENKEISCYGAGYFRGTNRNQEFATYLSIKGRGNASWEDEKKGYALTFYNSAAYDDKEGVNICGMGKSSKWTLIANYKDRTQLRNAIALSMAQDIDMEGAVEYIFVDFYLNGIYQGLYLLTEKVEADDDRINVIEATQDNLNGSYLLEFDNYIDIPQFSTASTGQLMTIKAPDNLESYTAIQKFVNEADNAISNINGYNEQSGKYWYEYIDIDSFAKLWIVREYTLEYDASVNFRLYYDAEDGRLHGGPAWDFDNALGRNVGQYADPTYTLFESGDRNPNGWMSLLLRFSDFTKRIEELYKEYFGLFNTPNESSVYRKTVQLREDMAASIEMNYIVWEEMLTYDKWNMPEDTTYEGHFQLLLEFIEQRNDFWVEYMK